MTSERFVWVDAGKGVALVALVLMHATIFAHLEWVEGSSAAFWRWYSGAIAPFMLPTLFLLSGAMRPWLAYANLFNRRTLVAIGKPLWIYAVWYIIYATVRSLGLITGAAPLSDPLALGRRFLAPNSVLWFLAAMSVWTIVVPLMRKLPREVALVVICIISSAWYWMPGQDGVDMYLRIISFGAFFAFGVYLREPIFASISRLSPGPFLAALLVFIACGFLRALDGALPLLAATFIPWCGSATYVLIFIIAVVCRSSVVATTLSWIGRYTLPFYVTHVLVFLALAKIPVWQGMIPMFAATRWGAPLLATLIAAAVTVLLVFVTRWRHLRWLFEPPVARKL